MKDILVMHMVVKVRSLVEVEKKWQVGVAHESSAAADVAHAGLLCFASVDYIPIPIAIVIA